MKILEKDLIVLDVQLDTPEEAIEKVADILIDKNLVNIEYRELLLNAFQHDINSFTFGDMAAVAHIDQYDASLEDALVLIRLKHSVNFGKNEVKPVRLIFGVVGTNSENDMVLFQDVVKLIHNKTAFSALLNEKTPESLLEVLHL